MVRLADDMISLHRQTAISKTALKRTALERQIEATDRQIDRLAHELYGLTDQEFAIVVQAENG